MPDSILDLFFFYLKLANHLCIPTAPECTLNTTQSSALFCEGVIQLKQVYFHLGSSLKAYECMAAAQRVHQAQPHCAPSSTQLLLLLSTQYHTRSYTIPLAHIYTQHRCSPLTRVPFSSKRCRLLHLSHTKSDIRAVKHTISFF